MPTKIEWAEESWNPVPGYDGYKVDVEGQILGPSGRVMKQMVMPGGYCYVLCNRGRGHQRKLFVHRAVLLAWVGVPCEGQECRHLDANPKNNRLSNLAWGTRLEQWDDRRRQNRVPRGHKHWSAKLKPYEIPIIRRLHQEGLSSRVIGQRFNVSHTTVLKIVRGVRWCDYG